MKEKKDEDELFEVSGYPKYQFTIVSKDINLTIRTTNKEELIDDVMDLRERLVKGVNSKSADEGLDQDFDNTAQGKNKKCPKCGGSMTFKKGISKKTNEPYSFWGCDNYPDCDGTSK